MDRYRRFAIETVALLNHIKDSATSGKDTVSVDARLFKALTTNAGKVSNGWMHHMDFKLDEEMRMLANRFNIVDKPKKRGRKKDEQPPVKNKVETFAESASA